MSQTQMQKPYTRQMAYAKTTVHTLDAGKIWNSLKTTGSASIRNGMRFIHYNPGQSIMVIYILILSCNCINNVLCDIEPQPANKFNYDDDDVPHTLVSLFKDSIHVITYGLLFPPLSSLFF